MALTPADYPTAVPNVVLSCYVRLLCMVWSVLFDVCEQQQQQQLFAERHNGCEWPLTKDTDYSKLTCK